MCQENAGVFQWDVRKLVQSARGMPWERIGMCAKCQGNAWQWVWLQIVQVMQGNAEECRGMPGERMGVGVTCQGNAGE